MGLTLQIIVGLAIVMLLGLGTMSMFAPRRMVKNFAIEPIGTADLSTIRSVIGGFFIASVAMLACSPAKRSASSQSPCCSVLWPLGGSLAS